MTGGIDQATVLELTEDIRAAYNIWVCNTDSRICTYFHTVFLYWLLKVAQAAQPILFIWTVQLGPLRQL